MGMEDNIGSSVERLIAKDQIREIVYSYSEAVTNRDTELMVSLYDSEASFGFLGEGESALRSMIEKTMGDLEFAVILVSNHIISFENDEVANGEVWARCYAQNRNEGYYEQLVKYVDQYKRSKAEIDGKNPWKFKSRRHFLLFGESRESPLKLPEASWPESNVGVGRIPLEDNAVIDFRNRES